MSRDCARRVKQDGLTTGAMAASKGRRVIKGGSPPALFGKAPDKAY